MKLARFDTPEDIARILSRHLPKGSGNILDPSIGSGKLLMPALSRFSQNEWKIVGLDLDKSSLVEARKNLSEIPIDRLDLVHAEFVKWASEDAIMKEHGESFDCVMMNPPFLGKTQDWVALSLDGSSCPARRMPVEVAFVYRSLGLLKQGGRMLAVLPSSVVSSDRHSWIRKELLRQGSIQIVHELPRFSFAGVESRMYLFVYKKGVKRQHIELRNHDLHLPKSLSVFRSSLDRSARLDYGYQDSFLRYQQLLRSSSLDWRSLDSLVEILRSTKHHAAKNTLIHTWSYKSGFWSRPLKGKPRQKRDKTVAKKSDILIARIGRHCSRSAGLLRRNAVGYTPSDCVLILRPKRNISTTKLLFVLRSTFANVDGERLLERGSGATYISASDLKALKFPWKLTSEYPNEYRRYRSAIAKRDLGTMESIENLIHGKLWGKERD